jgi:hypothetical protein
MKKERVLGSSVLVVLTVLSLMAFALQFKPLYGTDLSQITLQIDGMV